MCLHVNLKAHITCNCLTKTEALVKVLASHMHHKGSNMTEMV